MPVKARRSMKDRLRFSISDELLGELLVPEALDEPNSAYTPLDFTSISSRDVGRQHSMWAVRHSYLIFLVGKLRAEIGNLKYDIKNSEASWVIANSGRYKTKWQMDAALLRTKTLREKRKRLQESEGNLIRYEGLAEAYKGFRDAASREISRRQDERASRD